MVQDLKQETSLAAGKGQDIDQDIIEQLGKTFGWQPEIAEVAEDYFDKLPYPQPLKRYRLVFESPTANVESIYYWILEFLRQDLGFNKIEKIIDTFSASETSAFWGVVQQRSSIQEDRASQFLAVIGKMVKELFQIVRELRIIEERLNIYKYWGKDKASDITLKGLFIDLVEGGSKNPSSVYGMASEVGFTILPDLFFNTHVYNPRDVDRVVDTMPYNKAVRNVLKRKLLHFIEWAKSTHKELKNRWNFTLRYLRQHWAVIKMYISWVKPYLRNIQRLNPKQKHLTSADLITAFETSIIEIEILAQRKVANMYSCVLVNMVHRTRPAMSFQQEAFQRGPIHVGRVDVNIRAYAWSEEEIKIYKKLKEEEDMEILKLVDDSVRAAMDALKDDLERYLKEAGESEFTDKKLFNLQKETNKRKKQVGQASAIAPFKYLFIGIYDLIGALFGSRVREKPKKRVDKSKAKEYALFGAWLVYHQYKKSHGLLSW